MLCRVVCWALLLWIDNCIVWWTYTGQCRINSQHRCNQMVIHDYIPSHKVLWINAGRENVVRCRCWGVLTYVYGRRILSHKKASLAQLATKRSGLWPTMDWVCCQYTKSKLNGGKDVQLLFYLPNVFIIQKDWVVKLYWMDYVSEELHFSIINGFLTKS